MDNFTKNVNEIKFEDGENLRTNNPIYEADNRLIGRFSKGANIKNAPDPEEIVNEIEQQTQQQNKGSE